MAVIPYNKPYLTGKETAYIEEAARLGKISGNGIFTQRCQKFFENKYDFKKCLLTTSCTDALEMCAILLDIKPGDEVIIPSFTFVSTALAFVRQGAKIIFADSHQNHPGIDEDIIESLITPQTKVIVPVHYAGMACNMDKITDIAIRHGLYVVEDAAQAIDSFYFSNKKSSELRIQSSDNLNDLEENAMSDALYPVPLGSIGDFATFSFHETKNIQCGEGGMLVINNERFFKRAEIIWEKGTNRAEFFKGEVNKYSWVDIGSSFLPSEITSAFLFAQLENIKQIQEKRKAIWLTYFKLLYPLAKQGFFSIPCILPYATNNAHMFYLICNSLSDRTHFINYLKNKDIMVVFHYQSLHKSAYYKDKHDGRELPNSDRYSDCLVRLPLYYDLSFSDVKLICNEIECVFTRM